MFVLSSCFLVGFLILSFFCEVEVPENGRNTLLLTEEFIRNCVESFSVPSRGLDQNLRTFPQKHLNIIDPLKENNNLGRSVNRGIKCLPLNPNGLLCSV